MKISMIILFVVFIFAEDYLPQSQSRPIPNGIYNKIISAQYKTAIKELDKYIRNNKKDFNGYKYRGIAKDSLKLHEQAIKDFSKAIELSPQTSELYLLRGNSYKYFNDPDRAYSDYTYAISIDSNYAEAFYQRAELNNSNKQIISDLQRVVEIENCDTILTEKAKSLAFYKYQYILKRINAHNESYDKQVMVIQIDNIRVWDSDEYRYDNKNMPYTYSPPDGFYILSFVARAYGKFGFPFREVKVLDAETNQNILSNGLITERNIAGGGRYNIKTVNSPFCDVYESFNNYNDDGGNNYSFSNNYYLIKRKSKKIKIIFIDDDNYTLIYDNAK